MKTPSAVRDILELVRNLGGRVYLVGGAVVDHLLGDTPKDWDLEVHGVPFDALQGTLEKAGLNPKLVGREFGVLKINGGLDIDVSVPRYDNKIGAGHTDFATVLDPNMPPEEAARRRDLTINSMFYDLERGEILDPFNGEEDLKNGRIRATDPVKFAEDPLRVLRVMQLLPRKGTWVDPQTLELCRSLHSEFKTLSAERVLVEFEKLLLKAKKPSIGLEFLRECGWLSHFPELHALVGCAQNPEYHPEGDAWVHTLCVVDNAAVMKEWVPEEWRLAFMFGALLHDVGKPSTTDPEDGWSAKGHDKAGEPLAEAFMKRITNEKELTARAVALTRLHMQPYFLTHGEAKANAWRRLHNKCRLDVLGFMSLCDRAAAVPEILGNPHDRSLNCWKHFIDFGATGEAIKPKLLGRHLIETGMKPGPAFGVGLKAAYEAQLDNDELSLEELLKIALDAIPGKA